MVSSLLNSDPLHVVDVLEKARASYGSNQQPTHTKPQQTNLHLSQFFHHNKPFILTGASCYHNI
jgi:hypothetical protein